MADASGEALSKLNEAQIQEMAQENPTLLKKIARFMKKWIGDLKKQIEIAFRGTEAKTEVARQMQDALDEMAEMWNGLLVEAGKKANEGSAKEASPAAQTQQTTSPTARTQQQAQEADKAFIPYAHIDERSLDSVKDTHTELFCSEVEEAQFAYSAAASVLMSDLEQSAPGQKQYNWDKYGDLTVTGLKRVTSEMLARMKDDMGWTWDDIRKTLQSFIDMNDPAKGYPLVKNTVRNRRMEVYFHEMLTKGYTTIDGTRISPWHEYVESMAGYQGSKGMELNAQDAEGMVPFEEYAFADAFEDVKYSPRGSTDPDISSIKEQIANSQSKLDAMSPVYARQVHLPKSKKNDLVKWAKKELASTGYQVDRQNFGRIEFDESRINNSFNYLNSEGEYAAILALPRVLKRGIVVGRHSSHKYRGYPTITFAAPVEINGVRGNMAVVVKQESKNVYKTHRILMPDGSAFEYKDNAEPTPARGVARNGSYASPISSASTDIVAQDSDSVKFSVRDTADDAAYAEEAKKHFGKTYSYNKAGYIVTDGSMLDFSGKHAGYDSGGRSVDHREIWEVRELDDMSGTEAMVDFMAAGNIRLSPESGGINLIVMPTKAQEYTLSNYISKLRGEVIIDIDNERGETIHSFEYNRGTHANRVLGDLRAYFANGTLPEAQSSLAQFLYQQRDPDQVSDRELLATALQSVTQNLDEWDNLRRYQKKIAALNEKQRMLEQTDARIVELKGKTDRASRDEMIRLQNNAQTLARSIERADGELLKYEAMKPIKKLAERQRAEYRQTLKARTDERMRKYKERMRQDMQDRLRDVRAREAERGKRRLDKAVEHAREVGNRRVDRIRESEGRAKYKERIQKDVSTLRDWLTQPTNKGHSCADPTFDKEPQGAVHYG